jgi:uncharacterized protein
MLSDRERHAILDLAQRAVVARVERERAGRPAPLALPAATGVFVTLKRHGQLRGCLGTLECRRGLADEVWRCAGDAAAEDPRFPPVTPDELPEIDIDVSVLGPLEPIDPAAPDAIDVGRHGLVVEQGQRRGLLLPQVATEWNWDAAQFLRHTCLKAGLPADAWQHGAKVFRFEAEVFGADVPAAPPGD